MHVWGYLYVLYMSMWRVCVCCTVYVCMHLHICVYDSVYNGDIPLRAAALDGNDTLNRKYVWNFFFNIASLIQNQDIMQFIMYWFKKKKPKSNSVELLIKTGMGFFHTLEYTMNPKDTFCLEFQVATQVSVCVFSCFVEVKLSFSHLKNLISGIRKTFFIVFMVKPLLHNETNYWFHRKS